MRQLVPEKWHFSVCLRNASLEVQLNPYCSERQDPLPVVLEPHITPLSLQLLRNNGCIQLCTPQRDSLPAERENCPSCHRKYIYQEAAGVKTGFVSSDGKLSCLMFLISPISRVYRILSRNRWLHITGDTEGRSSCVSNKAINRQKCSGGQHGPQNHPSFGAPAARPARVKKNQQLQLPLFLRHITKSPRIPANFSVANQKPRQILRREHLKTSKASQLGRAFPAVSRLGCKMYLSLNFGEWKLGLNLVFLQVPPVSSTSGRR